MDESIADTIAKTGLKGGCGCGGNCTCGTSSATYSEGTLANVTVPTCRFCGEDSHGSVFCALIKEVEYYPDGSIKRVALTR